jgi:signal transduction histidine kinase
MIDCTSLPAPAPSAAAPDDAAHTRTSQHTVADRPRDLVELACSLLNASRGGIVSFTREGAIQDHLTGGSKPQVLQRWARDPAFLGLMSCAMQSSDVLRQTQPVGLAAPLLASSYQPPGRSGGVLYVVRDAGCPPFTVADEALLRPLGAWLAQDGYSEETRFRTELHLLNKVAQAAASNLDLGRILELSLQEIESHLPSYVAAVWLVEPDGGPGTDLDSALEHRRPLTGGRLPGSRYRPRRPSPDGLESTRQPALVLSALSGGARLRAAECGLVIGHRDDLDGASLAPCVTSNKPIFLQSAEDGAGREPGLYLGQAGPAWCFAVPLRAGERVVGLLHTVHTGPTTLSGDHAQLIRLVADLIGPAVSNCQLFARLSSAYEDLRVAQTSLVHTEKMRALGELASGMAHEFNNSLCGVLGFLELALINSGIEPATRALLESGRVCALDAAAVVRRIQDFGRRQKPDDRLQPLDLTELARQTVELARHKWESLARARAIPVRVTVEADGPVMISGRAPELREVLTNLLFNGVDAMPDGGRLTVCVRAAEGKASLVVSDTGTGMPDAVRQRLFEPFFTTKGEKGNGLGLSVVFGIVRRHGGRIDVETEVGRGTTFSIGLPLLESQTGTCAQPESAKAPESQRSLRILVIEDEEPIQRFLQAALTSMGHRPILTGNAGEGLAAFVREPIDVVLTDLGLPGVSGEEVARIVHENAPDTPIVLVTGWGDQLHAEADSPQGVAQVLSKPVTLQTLTATLAEVCPS